MLMYTSSTSFYSFLQINEKNDFWESQHEIYLKKVNLKRFLSKDVSKVLFKKVQNKFGTHFFVSSDS